MLVVVDSSLPQVAQNDIYVYFAEAYVIIRIG